LFDALKKLLSEGISDTKRELLLLDLECTYVLVNIMAQM
jgi:hypothetical protein